MSHRLALPISLLLVACLIASRPAPAGAATDLGTWCQAEGADWNASADTCTVLEPQMAVVGGTLTILRGETLANYGTILNDSYGTIVNDGDIDNAGTIENYGIMDSDSAIYNDGWVDNHGPIYNKGLIVNFGTIDNWDTLYNMQCLDALFVGNAVKNHVAGAVYDLEWCSYLSLLIRE